MSKNVSKMQALKLGNGKQIYLQNTIGSWVSSETMAAAQVFHVRKIIVREDTALKVLREARGGPGRSLGSVHVGDLARKASEPHG